jgi:hypothetical protein
MATYSNAIIIVGQATNGTVLAADQYAIVTYTLSAPGGGVTAADTMVNIYFGPTQTISGTLGPITAIGGTVSYTLLTGVVFENAQ